MNITSDAFFDALNIVYTLQKNGKGMIGTLVKKTAKTFDLNDEDTENLKKCAIEKIFEEKEPEGILSFYTACVRLDGKNQTIEDIPCEELAEELKAILLRKMK